MIKSLPERPSLDHLRGQAHRLLDGSRANDPEAQARFDAQRPGRSTPKLADALKVIAFEYGFPSWAKLREEVQSRRNDPKVFFDAVISGDLATANRLKPKTIGDIWTAALLGDASAVSTFLADDKTLVSQPGGPRKWRPLLYACYSRFDKAKATETAQALLDAGADPSEFDNAQGFRNSALYASTGVTNNPPLARLLLERGAAPDDGESLYHSAELPDHDCLNLLFEFGVNPAGTNALPRKLDFDDYEGVKLMLEKGTPVVDNLGSALHATVLRNRAPRFLDLLIQHGAKLDHLDADGRTAYALARVHGNELLADHLALLGSSRELSKRDELLVAIGSGDVEWAKSILAEHPDTKDAAARRALPEAAQHGRLPQVKLMVELGWDLQTPGSSTGTALHWAAMTGNVGMVDYLIKAGARLDQEDTLYHGLPLGWAIHGSRDKAPDRDYPAVIRLLLAAGTPVSDTLRNHSDPEIRACAL